jgi:hypothetical protein
MELNQNHEHETVSRFLTDLQKRLESSHDPRTFSISLIENLIIVRCGDCSIAGDAWKSKNQIASTGYGFAVYYGREEFDSVPPTKKRGQKPS